MVGIRDSAHVCTRIDACMILYFLFRDEEWASAPWADMVAFMTRQLQMRPIDLDLRSQACRTLLLYAGDCSWGLTRDQHRALTEALAASVRDTLFTSGRTQNEQPLQLMHALASYFPGFVREWDEWVRFNGYYLCCCKLLPIEPALVTSVHRAMMHVMGPRRDEPGVEYFLEQAQRLWSKFCLIETYLCLAEAAAVSGGSPRMLLHLQVTCAYLEHTRGARGFGYVGKLVPILELAAEAAERGWLLFALTMSEVHIVLTDFPKRTIAPALSRRIRRALCVCVRESWRTPAVQIAMRTCLRFRQMLLPYALRRLLKCNASETEAPLLAAEWLQSHVPL